MTEIVAFSKESTPGNSIAINENETLRRDTMSISSCLDSCERGKLDEDKFWLGQFEVAQQFIDCAARIDARNDATSSENCQEENRIDELCFVLDLGINGNILVVRLHVENESILRG